MDIIQLKTNFKLHFGQEPRVFRAPARVNLIGEHTDYNDGYVFPLPIDRYIYFCVSKQKKTTLDIIAHDLKQRKPLSPGSTESDNTWTRYMSGVLAVLREEGLETGGMQCLFGGDIPMGAGMSSSSALTCGFLFALNALYELKLSRKEMALLAQKAEHKTGVRGGIMDQFTILCGKKDAALLLDCRDLSYDFVPLDFGDFRLVLFDSGVSHNLATTEYNVRRNTCEKGLETIRKKQPEIKSIRDLSIETLEKNRSMLTPVQFKRLRYVIAENQRVLATVNALKGGDLTAIGQLLYASHNGLKTEYEVSCPELDFLVEQARELDGVAGGRMMGGGFGGSTINLVHKDAIASVHKILEKAYKKTFARQLSCIVVRPANAVEEVTGMDQT